MTSGRFTPAASTFINTSPRASSGLGRSTGTSTSGPPGLLISIASIGCLSQWLMCRNSELILPRISQSPAGERDDARPDVHVHRSDRIVAAGESTAAIHLPAQRLRVVARSSD